MRKLIMTFISQNIVSRSELNGCFACISGPFDPESCRWPVRIFLKEGACNHLKTIIYASRDDSPQGPPAIALLKQANLECSIFMMSPIYAMSTVGFGMSFIKKRFGGGALTATLASKMLKNAAAGSASPFLSLIMRRVFGGRGSEVIGHSVRQELRHMIYQQPVCTYMRSLQVCCLLAAPSTCSCIRVAFLQAEARWRIACDRSSIDSESSARTGLFSADAFNARICTAAEDLHIDIVELCCIAEPNAVLAKDR
jgi:hypothetical protein